MAKNYSNTVPFGLSQQAAGYFRSPLPDHWIGATIEGLQATEWFHVQASSYRRDGGHLHHAGYTDYRINQQPVDQDAARVLVAIATLARANKLPAISATIDETIDLIARLSAVQEYQCEADLDRGASDELRRYMAKNPDATAAWAGFSIGLPGFDKIWEAVRPRYVTVVSGSRIQYNHFFVRSYEVLDLTSGQIVATVWSPDPVVSHALEAIADWTEELTRQGLLSCGSTGTNP